MQLHLPYSRVTNHPINNPVFFPRQGNNSLISPQTLRKNRKPLSSTIKTLCLVQDVIILNLHSSFISYQLLKCAPPSHTRAPAAVGTPKPELALGWMVYPSALILYTTTTLQGGEYTLKKIRKLMEYRNIEIEFLLSVWRELKERASECVRSYFSSSGVRRKDMSCDAAKPERAAFRGVGRVAFPLFFFFLFKETLRDTAHV